MGADALMQVLHQLPHVKDKDLMVGIESSDDAAVYKVSDSVAVISTMDFFPPIVDDPVIFGEIAAANALSDVYAMGGTPRLALNIVCFPKKLALDVLNDILRGSMSKLAEASTLLVGGHSVEDTEVKYGLSVTGFVHPDNVVTNRGARAGDVLVLTKPLGVGIITSALKAGRLAVGDAATAIDSMRALNRAASEVMVSTGVNACTDVTGYGLMGHAMEMARGSSVGVIIKTGEVPVFPRALDMARFKAARPRTIATNMKFLSPDVVKSAPLDEFREMVLYDPQTSGGLLVSVPGEKLGALTEGLASRGVTASVIGSVVDEEPGWRIRLE